MRADDELLSIHLQARSDVDGALGRVRDHLRRARSPASRRRWLSTLGNLLLVDAERYEDAVDALTAADAIPAEAFTWFVVRDAMTNALTGAGRPEEAAAVAWRTLEELSDTTAGAALCAKLAWLVGSGAGTPPTGAMRHLRQIWMALDEPESELSPEVATALCQVADAGVLRRRRGVRT
ncbi:MAG: hypothetical protein KC621_14915 [Myxococcales bacterium]|nr:hypothetical protein [Myxococcales bacterium]